MAVDPTVGAPRKRRRRTALAIALVSVVVLALTTTWLAAGRTPHLATGSFGMVDPEAHAGPEGLDAQSIVTDPSDGTNDAIWSFRNAGRLPVEVSVASPQPAAPVLQAVHVFVLDPRDAMRNVGAAAEVVTLHPDEEMGVVVSVGFGCGSLIAGTGVAVDTVVMRVTTLGITRSITLRGPESVGVKTTRNLPGTDCR